MHVVHSIRSCKDHMAPKATSTLAVWPPNPHSPRTPSIDSLDTASPSEAPATPRTQAMLPHDLPPVSISPLEELERYSRFRVPGVCMTCKRAGSNFPHCGKCGDMWCSRQCRTGAAGTHACHGRTVNAAADVRVL